MHKNSVIFTGLLLGLSIFACVPAFAQEVDKGKIPEEQLATSYKQLPWGVSIWDVPEVTEKMNAEDKNIVWIDTRPASVFANGTVRGAVVMTYDKTGSPDNTLTAESLNATISKAGLTKDTAKVVFFCQGPKCHRSYNATHVAVAEWGFKADNVVWFRAGYPDLLQACRDDAKLKRKASKYLSDEGVKDL